MSVITTYLNNNAQTPLGRLVVYMLYKQVCNKHGDKSNRWSLSLSVRQHKNLRLQISRFKRLCLLNRLICSLNFLCAYGSWP